jgi:hypothetical protein
MNSTLAGSTYVPQQPEEYCLVSSVLVAPLSLSIGSSQLVIAKIQVVAIVNFVVKNFTLISYTKS